MGAAEVVHGVSGGSVAFITGIYDELLHSIRAIDIKALRLLIKLDFSEFWKKINGNFLMVLFAGISTSLFSLVKLMTILLKYHPVSTWSFFFGLIIISVPLVLHEINRWNSWVVLFFVLGVVMAYTITVVSPIQSPENLWFVFFAGAIAICAMFLPGISIAFALLLIGKFQYLMTALNDINVLVIFVFMAGCIIGIICFSRILSWILDNYHSAAVALLAGIMLGSLNKVWPWREVLEYATNNKGKQVPVFDKSILPWHYLATTGKDPQVLQAILLMALGVFFVVLIEKVAKKLKTKI